MLWKKLNQRNFPNFTKFEKCSEELPTQNDSEFIHQSVLIKGIPYRDFIEYFFRTNRMSHSFKQELFGRLL